MTAKALFKQAQKLDPDERTALAEMLWQSVDNAPLSEELKAELDRRLEAIEKNPKLGSPWPEVKQRLQRRLRAARKHR